MSFVITRPKPALYRVGDEAGIFLMSDLHIGGSHTQHKLIQHELRQALEHGWRVNINGDVIDAIVSKDSKRFTPSCVARRLRGRDDILTGEKDWAYEILEPYADIIDMIGEGNHDKAIRVHHGEDPVLEIVGRLNDKLRETGSGHRINHGAYRGFIDYRWHRSSGGGVRRVVIFYHHGAGGVSQSTKGIMNFGRLQAWVDSDVIWIGHTHNSLSDSTPMRVRCPLSGNSPAADPVKNIMTGSYLWNLDGLTQEGLRKDGRPADYAGDAMLPPQNMGGTLLRVTFTRNGKSLRVEH